MRSKTGLWKRGAAAIAVAAMSVIGVAGCGGGNGNGLTIPNTGGNGGNGGNGNIAAARENLLAATAPGATNAQIGTALQNAISNFQDVLAGDPNNAEARAGLGIAQLALVGLTAAQQNGGVALRSTATSNSNLFDFSKPSTVIASAANIEGTGQRLLDNLKLLVAPAGGGSSTRSVKTRGVVGDTQDFLAAQLPTLKDAAENLRIASGNSGVTIQIVNSPTHNSLRQADLKILTGAAQALAGIVSVSVAYNLDPGTYYDNRSFSNPAALDTNHDLKLTASEYVAPAPFGTLRTGGAQNFRDTLTFLGSSVTSLNAGITAKLNEQDAASEAVQLTADVRPQLIKAQGFVPTIQSFVNGVATIPNTPVRINLPGFFNNPVNDLHTIAPTFSYNASTREVTPVAGQTFNGLFPDGIPTDIFAD